MSAAAGIIVQMDETAQIAEVQEGQVHQLPISGTNVLPGDVVLNRMLASVGLQSEDPAVALSVFLLVFVLVVGACRSRRCCQAASRSLRPAAAKKRRGSHRAVSTREEAGNSDDADEEPVPRRRRQRNQRARPQCPKAIRGISQACGTEFDHATCSISGHAEPLQNTRRGQRSGADLEMQIGDEEEVEVEEVTDSEADVEAVSGEGAEAMDSEAVADRAMKHAQEKAVHIRAEELSATEEKRAMERRIALLELALASKQADSEALVRQQTASEDDGFDFAVQPPAEQSSRNDDDAMTMCMLDQGPASGSRELLPASDTQDKRQARLESVLRRKKEAQGQKADAEAEQAKQAARRVLRKELLYMDNELDSMTNASTEGASSDAGSSARHLIAAKWMLAYSYSKYPPRSFSARRAKEELQLVRDLRSRDAVLKGLKLLQNRYAPVKNTVAEHGAEWAVVAEEIAKHAFALQTGISRAAKQGAVRHSDACSDQLHTGQTGGVELGQVYDAD